MVPKKERMKAVMMVEMKAKKVAVMMAD